MMGKTYLVIMSVWLSSVISFDATVLMDANFHVSSALYLSSFDAIVLMDAYLVSLACLSSLA